MNFFEHQEKARKQSRWLIGAFLLVTLLIVVVIDLLILVVVNTQSPLMSQMGQPAASQFFSIQNIQQHSGVLTLSSVITGGVILLSSLGKITSLRSGGAKVARDLGGTLVTADARDPLHRRLYNVVEEISIASGTTVPDVFILENEPAINAFAAGYGTADAAVAVTQGTLEKLNRAELQGVVAHEFSHIFNGDMRINIRLMGIVFGIMILALVGRKFLHASRFRRSSSRNDGAGAVIAIGLGMMVVGYIGLFFARWMKSAISRQREYLADASAVQFTRDPSGIAGALKKIAAYNHSSYLHADAEEVSHMLFSKGVRSMMFATHPPLEQRIQRIEKHFDSNEIDALAKKLKNQERREHIQAVAAQTEQEQKRTANFTASALSIGEIIDHIGNPDMGLITAAAVFSESLPESLVQAAHSTEWSPEVLIYSLLDNDQQRRDKQLLIVIEEMGELSEARIRHLISNNGLVSVDQRYPLMEIAYPSLKRRPISDVDKILATIDRIALVDEDVDSFEYLLSRLIKQHLFESHTPNRTRLHGKQKLKSMTDELTMVVSILASHGQSSKSSEGLQLAQRAFRAGMSSVGIEHKNLSFVEDWQNKLDTALTKLDKLSAPEKAKVVLALGTTVLDDKKLITEEQEMMRVICALIHVPMPMLQTAVASK